MGEPVIPTTPTGSTCGEEKGLPSTFARSVNPESAPSKNTEVEMAPDLNIVVRTVITPCPGKL